MSNFGWKDSYQTLHPDEEQYSQYYSNQRGQGASRIDGSYHVGDIGIKTAEYIPIAFSDHMAYRIVLKSPNILLCPNRSLGGNFFIIKAEVLKDDIFKMPLREAMGLWNELRVFGLNIFMWSENVFKSGGKEISSKKRERDEEGKK